jgi:hypothetical protein
MYLRVRCVDWMQKRLVKCLVLCILCMHCTANTHAVGDGRCQHCPSGKYADVKSDAGQMWKKKATDWAKQYQRKTSVVNAVAVYWLFEQNLKHQHELNVSSWLHTLNKLDTLTSALSASQQQLLQAQAMNKNLSSQVDRITTQLQQQTVLLEQKDAELRVVQEQRG